MSATPRPDGTSPILTVPSGPDFDTAVSSDPGAGATAWRDGAGIWLSGAVYAEVVYSPDDDGWYADRVASDGSTICTTGIYPTRRSLISAIQQGDWT